LELRNSTVWEASARIIASAGSGTFAIQNVIDYVNVAHTVTATKYVPNILRKPAADLADTLMFAMVVKIGQLAG
jgi:hypothetical protein